MFTVYTGRLMPSRRKSNDPIDKGCTPWASAGLQIPLRGQQLTVYRSSEPMFRQREPRKVGGEPPVMVKHEQVKLIFDGASVQ